MAHALARTSIKYDAVASSRDNFSNYFYNRYPSNLSPDISINEELFVVKELFYVFEESSRNRVVLSFEISFNF